ncbi:GGDEF domain-containing protein [bacterium]|nr:GGDEF domain-containing protein [bacterium]
MFARSPDRQPSAVRLFLAAAICACVPFTTASGADDPLWIDGSTGGAIPCGHVSYLADPGGELALADVLARDDWREVEQEIANFGYTADAYWLRFRMANRAPGEDECLIEIAYPLLDDIVFHQVHAGRVLQTRAAGDAQPFAARPLDYTNFVFPVAVAVGEAHDILLRVRSSSSLQVPLAVWSETGFRARITRNYALYGLFYGIMLSIIIYGLSIFLTMRERNYLHFAVYTLLFVGIKASMDGVAYQYLWPRSPFVQDHSITFFLAGTTAAAYLFASHFLRLWEVAPRLRRVFWTLGWVAALLSALSLVLSYTVLIRPVLVLALASVFLVLGSGIWVWRRRDSKPAMMFTAAWSAFMLGSLMMIVSKFGVLPRTVLTENGPALGIMAEAALMILALTESLKESRRKQRRATEDLLKVEAEAGRKLKQEVQRQTGAIQDMMRQLAQANEVLEQHNQQDGLTGIFNRKAFDKRLATEHYRSVRSGLPLSLLMIDIDLFKKFNDDYGHLTGDECLKQVAAIIDEEARRTTDYAARYGGEEFAVILADTPGPDAAKVGERIRAAVEAMDFIVDGQRVLVNVSVGVGTLPPGADGDHPEAVVAAADMALYCAKENGRNRVELAPAAEPVS